MHNMPTIYLDISCFEDLLFSDGLIQQLLAVKPTYVD